jgi:hypothetical protein
MAGQFLVSNYSSLLALTRHSCLSCHNLAENPLTRFCCHRDEWCPQTTAKFLLGEDDEDEDEDEAEDEGRRPYYYRSR